MFKKIKDKFKETGLINELCEHLRSIGINATLLESGSSEAIGGTLVLGNVKVEGRNLDLIQVERQPGGGSRFVYQYHYVVRANVEGLEDKLKADAKPVTKGLFSKEVVDLKWEGKELAQLLNTDSDLKSMLLKEGLDKVVVRPDKKHQCVMITHPPKIPRQVSVSIGGLPSIPVRGGGLTAGRKEFPTLEEFDAYDRIAKHIRSIAGVRP